MINQFHPLDAGRGVLAPGRSIYVFHMKVRNAPGILWPIAKVFADFNVNIIYVVMNVFTPAMKEGCIHFFADFTNVRTSPENIVNAIKPFVLEVNYDHSSSLVVDTYHFPLNVFGMRALIFTAEFMQHMFDEFKRVAGNGARALLWNLGHMAGYLRIKDYVKLLKEAFRMDLSNYEIARICCGIVQSYGWGVFEVIKWDEDKGEFTVRVWDSFESSHVKSKRKNPQCSFIGGMLCGVAKGLFGRDFQSSEVKCIAMGDEYCEFHIRLRD